MPGPEGAPASLRVLDLTDELGAAAVRTLVGIGADVARCRTPGAPSEGLAAELHWYAGTVLLPPEPGDSPVLDRWAEDVDVVLESGPVRSLRGVRFDAASGRPDSRWPHAVHVVITPFGLTGPRRDWYADDLVLASAGGMTWLGGRADGPPKPPPREQALQLAGVHGAIAALLGVLAANREAGRGGPTGQLVDISAQEATAATLETGAISWIHAGSCPRRNGGVYQHVAHRVFPAADGFVAGGYSGSDRMWTDLLKWMIEAGEAEDLADDAWSDPVHRWAGRPHVDEVVARFASRRTAAELADEGRRRALPWAEVSRAEGLPDNPQLRDRGFFVHIDGVPGHPDLVDVGPPVAVPGVDRPRTVAAARVVERPGWRSGPRAPAVRRLTAADAAAGPLTGLRVLDLTWVLAGPYATRLLADHGADVIKVESRFRQDPTRFSPGMRLRPGAGPDESGYFQNFNRGKRSVAINMRTEAGQDLVRRLAGHCDVVIDNYSPGTMSRWGLGYDALTEANPGVIAVSMSGVGQTGPWRNAVTFADTLAAMSGLTHETADPAGTPQGLTFGLGDMVAANAAVVGVLDLLLRGRGGFVDLSQLEAMASAMGPALLEHQLGAPVHGATPEHPDRRASRVPHGVYPAQGEDRWLSVAVLEDAQWRALVRAAVADGRGAAWAETLAGLADAGLAERKAAEDRIDDAVSAWTSDQVPEALADRLQALGVPAAIVSTGQDLVDRDPHLAARGFYVELEHPLAGPVRHEGVIARMSRTATRQERPAPLLGQHTDAVLTELLGLEAAEIRALTGAGVLE
ncbi:CoA transferase [Blastococcus sp. BMG 814]|uniref:CoA transferase n=1 Tax=Blastococcus carthaginiensis TaxID=3050034 RepID=A0ABT9IAD1_9ACTN|nr:CoA transferase [Blastococcus carthaginiensis]MDP5182528.1 CoA transferase [Blastococcus carthaginiensis]